MNMSIEQLEQILVEHFRCDKVKANLIANLIKDFDNKIIEFIIMKRTDNKNKIINNVSY